MTPAGNASNNGDNDSHRDPFEGEVVLDECPAAAEEFILTLGDETHELLLDRADKPNESPTYLMVCAGIFDLHFVGCDESGLTCLTAYCRDDHTCSFTLRRDTETILLNLDMHMTCGPAFARDITWIDARFKGTATLGGDAGTSGEGGGSEVVGHLTYAIPTYACLR
jgi:hypothetical protein